MVLEGVGSISSRDSVEDLDDEKNERTLSNTQMRFHMRLTIEVSSESLATAFMGANLYQDRGKSGEPVGLSDDRRALRLGDKGKTHESFGTHFAIAERPFLSVVSISGSGSSCRLLVRGCLLGRDLSLF